MYDVGPTLDDAFGSGEQEQQERITVELRAINERRAVIEQAKGMLMFVYGIDADEAFEALRGQSQNHNVRLVLVAEQVVKDLVKLSRTRGPVRQLALGGLIEAASGRIAHSGSSAKRRD